MPRNSASRLTDRARHDLRSLDLKVSANKLGRPILCGFHFTQ